MPRAKRPITAKKPAVANLSTPKANPIKNKAMTDTSTSKEKGTSSSGISGLNSEEKVAARKEILEIIKESNEPVTQPVKSNIAPPKTIIKKPDPVRGMTSEKPHTFDRPGETSSSKPSSKGKQSSGRSMGYFGLALLVIIVLAFVVGAYGFYRLNWVNSTSVSVAKAMSLPAVIVNNKLVSYKSYDHDIRALKQYYQKQSETSPNAVPTPTEQEFKTIILDKLIQDEVMAQQAKTMDISVSTADIDAEMQNVLADAGSEEVLKQSLSELYGWGIEDFRNTVLKPYLLRQKVQTKLANDQSLPGNQDARKRADDVATLAKDPANKFEDLAAKYNEDQASPNGGDLGYLTKDDLVKEFSDVAFALKPGEVSDVVQTRYGFHIIKLEEKIISTGNESTTIPAGVEAVHVRHILILPIDVDKWLAEKVAAAKIYQLLKK